MRRCTQCTRRALPSMTVCTACAQEGYGRQTDSTEELVQQYVRKGGQIRRQPSSRRSLTGRQVELLTQADYAQLAVEKTHDDAEKADRAGRRAQRG